MCGIIGYVGKKESVNNTLIKGLRLLEYRGYDSAGVCYLDSEQEFEMYRSIGKIKELENITSLDDQITLGIGHTRWATHGKVNECNTHPHVSKNGRIILVHNGVINNYLDISDELVANGYGFYGETDSEIIANYIEFSLKNNNMMHVLLKLNHILKGSFALAIIDSLEKDKLYFIKNKTPLLIGVGEEFNLLISDVNAGASFTDKFVLLNEEEYGYISKKDINVYSNNNKITPIIKTINIKQEDISKGGFPHYMIKEIFEQPLILQKICDYYLNSNNDLINIPLDLINKIKQSSKIYIVACGTSYHAGLVGKTIIENNLNKSVEVVVASEFDNTLIIEGSFVIFISQSGETYDVKMALARVKGKYPTLLLTNVMTSSLSRECDYSLDILAGPEIAVASTKAYLAEIAILLLIVYSLNDNLENYRNEIMQTCVSIEETLIKSHHILAIVKDSLVDKENCFYIGKGIDYYHGLEASLKMKEISYIHSEAFPSGELKHGTIALVDHSTPVIGIISQIKTGENVRSNLKEVESRNAKIIIVSTDSTSIDSDDFIIKDVSQNMISLALMPVFQLMAYYAALLRYKDIDKPRNLAKSVTVE